MQPGRLVSFHCMLFPASKGERDGFIGKGFSGRPDPGISGAGFIFHAETVIWKDPVTQMQRTKALGLLHKTVRENASMCRQGIPDYLITMRTPGDVVERVKHTPETYPVQKWQQVAVRYGWTSTHPTHCSINPPENTTTSGTSARCELK